MKRPVVISIGWFKWARLWQVKTYLACGVCRAGAGGVQGAPAHTAAGGNTVGGTAALPAPRGPLAHPLIRGEADTCSVARGDRSQSCWGTSLDLCWMKLCLVLIRFLTDAYLYVIPMIR